MWNCTKHCLYPPFAHWHTDTQRHRKRETEQKITTDNWFRSGLFQATHTHALSSRWITIVIYHIQINIIISHSHVRTQSINYIIAPARRCIITFIITFSNRIFASERTMRGKRQTNMKWRHLCERSNVTSNVLIPSNECWSYWPSWVKRKKTTTNTDTDLNAIVGGSACVCRYTWSTRSSTSTVAWGGILW